MDNTDMIQLYRFRIWPHPYGSYRVDGDNAEKNSYKFDEEIMVLDVPAAGLGEFHQENEVYTIVDGTVDEPVLVILCDNGQKVRDYISGLLFSFKLDEIFSKQRT